MRESFRTKYDNLVASLFIDLFLQSPFKTFEVGLRRFTNLTQCMCSSSYVALRPSERACAGQFFEEGKFFIHKNMIPNLLTLGGRLLVVTFAPKKKRRHSVSIPRCPHSPGDFYSKISYVVTYTLRGLIKSDICIPKYKGEIYGLGSDQMALYL